MKFWQIVWGVSPPSPVCTTCPDYEAVTLQRNAHTHTPARCEDARRSSLVNWSEHCFASILLITPFLYSLPWKWVSVMLFCRSHGERRRKREWRERRETEVERESVCVCHMPLIQPVESFSLIHHSTLQNEAVGKAEGQTNSTLSAILLSLLIMWDNYSYICPCSTCLTPSTPPPPHSPPHPLIAVWINKWKIKTRCFRRRRQQLRSLPGLSAAWLDRRWQRLRPAHPGPDS